MLIPRNQFLKLSLFLLLPTFASTQVIDQIDIHLSIMERIGDEQKALPNATLVIPDQGQVQTDEKGKFNFKYAVRNNVDPELKITLQSDRHKLLKPLDGAIQLDASREEMYIEFLVVNMSKESPAFRKRIRDLEKRIRTLQSKNRLTSRQLNAVNNLLVDTLIHFEKNRQDLESKIGELSEALGTAEDVNEKQKQELEKAKATIAELEERITDLTAQVEAAKEEQFLRQNEHFSQIYGNLIEYFQRAKDIRDLLPYIKQEINSGSLANFANSIDKYNKVYTKLNTNSENYLLAVDRYWDKAELSQELDEIMKLIIKGIHAKQILPVITNIRIEINRQRANKAQKMANEFFYELDKSIKELEQEANSTLRSLRRNI